MATLLRDGKTPPVAGFFTRDGKAYSARLALDKKEQVQVLPAKEEEAAELEHTGEEIELGPCPMCNEGKVMKTQEGYVCSQGKKNGCPMKLPTKLCQRIITPEEAKAYITQRRTDVLDGFISRRGSPFRAALVLGEKGKIEWEFPPRGENSNQPGETSPGEIIDPEPLGPCPVCKKGNILSAENAYICRAEETTCAFRFPRIILKREITREEATGYVAEGHTDVLDDFISRRGRPFRATLYLKKNGKHGFKFPPREG